MGKKPVDPEAWREILTGESKGLVRSRRFFAHIPSTPRCKLCNSPFGRPGSLLMNAIRRGPSPLNRRLCKWCIPSLHKHPGGAELKISALFADIRGSTGLAEGSSAGDFSHVLARFYGVAAAAVDEHDGIVDKFVGDAAVALFIPSFCDQLHAAGAIATAKDLLRATGNDGAEPWLPLGIGVDTGVSFVGVVGQGDAVDFTAVGDPVNTASRLSGLAAPGELLLSAATATAAGLDTTGLEHRTLVIRGREHPVETFALRV
jgi:adenylate cyclase